MYKILIETPEHKSTRKFSDLLEAVSEFKSECLNFSNTMLVLPGRYKIQLTKKNGSVMSECILQMKDFN